jgi:hypothetical protein
MAISPRVNPIAAAQNIIQRGSHRHVYFVSEQGFGAYIVQLKKYSKIPS